MVSTSTTATPSSTPNTTIMGAGVGPSPSQAAAGPHYITQGGGGTQTYHIFHMPTSQGQVSQYFPGVPGGLLQAATAVPGYHVAAPGTPYFPNFINPMIPANSDFFQPNVKSSNRGGHNNYKGRGRGGRGGGNNDRNTPHSGAGPSSSQASYASNYQSYNPGAGQQFSGYGGPSQSYAKNNGNRNNWETSSQHSNSSQKKSFSSSSGSSLGHEASVTNTPPPAWSSTSPWSRVTSPVTPADTSPDTRRPSIRRPRVTTARALGISITMHTQLGACRTPSSPRSLSPQTRGDEEVVEAPVEVEMTAWGDTTQCPEVVTPGARVVRPSVTPPMSTSRVTTPGARLGSESIPPSQCRSQGQSLLARRQTSK